MPTVSYTEVKLFRKCQQAHNYRYVQNLKKKAPAVGLFRGSILHEMMDGYINSKRLADYTGKDPWEVLEEYETKFSTLLHDERERYGDLINDCENLFRYYIRYYKADPLKYEDSEAFVARDLTADIRFIGYIDKVARDKEDRRWLVDHKFVKSIPSDADRFSEIQLLIYYWAWEGWQPDVPVTGLMWDFTRTSPPREPDLLKNGSLSKAKNQNTDAYTYLQAIAKHGLNPDDYADILEFLKGKERTFFDRQFIARPSQDLQDMVVEDFKRTAVMIQRLKDIPVRNMGVFNCKTCEFRELCEAEVSGHDSEYIKKCYYTSRGDRDASKEAFDNEDD